MSAFTINPLLAEGGGFNIFEWHPGVVFWTLLIFAISLPLMIKFVFGPIVAALDERDRKVEAAASAAEDARLAAEAAVAKAEAEGQKVREEARHMKVAADERIARFEQEAMEKVKADADRMRTLALADIEADRRRMLADVRGEVVSLAIASAEKVLRQSVDEAASRRLVDDFLASKN